MGRGSGEAGSGDPGELHDMERAVDSEREFSARLSVKVREQASDLQSQAEEIEWLQEYRALCESKLSELAPGLKLPPQEAPTRRGSLSPVRRAFGLRTTPSYVVSMNARHRNRHLEAETQISKLEKRASQAEDRGAELSRQANEYRRLLDAKEKELLSSHLKRERLQEKLAAAEAGQSAANEYARKLEFTFQTHKSHALLKKNAQLMQSLEDAEVERARLEEIALAAQAEARDLEEALTEMRKLEPGGDAVPRASPPSGGQGEQADPGPAAEGCASPGTRRAVSGAEVDALQAEVGLLRRRLEEAEEDRSVLLDHVEELRAAGAAGGGAPGGAGEQPLAPGGEGPGRRVAELEAEVAAREAEVREMCRIHEELLATVREQRPGAAEEAGRELQLVRDELEGWRARCAELESALAGLRAQATESQQLAGQLEGDLLGARGAVDAARAGEAAAESRARELEAAVAAKGALVARMERLVVQQKVTAEQDREGEARREEEVASLEARCTAAEGAAGEAGRARELLESRLAAAEAEARRLLHQLRERENELTRKGVELARAQQERSRALHELEHAASLRAEVLAMAADFCGPGGAEAADLPGGAQPPGEGGAGGGAAAHPPSPVRMGRERTALYRLRALCDAHARRQREHAESRARLQAQCNSLLEEKHALAVALARCQQQHRQVADARRAAQGDLELARRHRPPASSSPSPSPPTSLGGAVGVGGAARSPVTPLAAALVAPPLLSLAAGRGEAGAGAVGWAGSGGVRDGAPRDSSGAAGREGRIAALKARLGIGSDVAAAGGAGGTEDPGISDSRAAAQMSGPGQVQAAALGDGSSRGWQRQVGGTEGPGISDRLDSLQATFDELKAL